MIFRYVRREVRTRQTRLPRSSQRINSANSSNINVEIKPNINVFLKENGIQNPPNKEIAERLENPSILIPKPGPATPRFPSSILQSIESQLKTSVAQRSLPTSDISQNIREYALIPDARKIKLTKGKLNDRVRKTFKNMKNEDSEIEYVSPMKPRARLTVMNDNETADINEDSSTYPISPGRSKRQVRMSETIKVLLGEILSKDYQTNPFLSPTKISITDVHVSETLTKCHIKWLPLTQAANESEITNYQRAFERSKGSLRWKLTERLSYLRQSPELSFSYDKRRALIERAYLQLEKESSTESPS